MLTVENPLFTIENVINDDAMVGYTDCLWLQLGRHGVWFTCFNCGRSRPNLMVIDNGN